MVIRLDSSEVKEWLRQKVEQVMPGMSITLVEAFDIDQVIPHDQWCIEITLVPEASEKGGGQ